MLFHFFTSLIDQYSFFNVFKYLTFRTGLSVISSLIIVFIIGAPLIKMFSDKMITGPIRQDGPIDHIVKKTGTDCPACSRNCGQMRSSAGAL